MAGRVSTNVEALFNVIDKLDNARSTEEVNDIAGELRHECKEVQCVRGRRLPCLRTGRLTCAGLPSHDRHSASTR